ncbi:MarR family transcriptional regulator [Vibrio sp.]|uniref:MarR family transcriptional regulator n=1 Tax=Vibrio viridaestus TaxID=2487322 RepID=A0A3N9TMJ2_9VIBR|nr:MarR family transcriptional regulator [Vibrio viridaestus]MDC0611874.1 MarR family transcriptional regulator [Vibrio sp.]RQW64865.1 MarR family transcriptional regulator [Vibrio viridaestus]
METHEEVLVSLRQIIRAIDLYSKKIKREYGLTSPQLLLMKAIHHSSNITIRQLSSNTNMSQATATSILDRLEARGFVVRERDTKDKRKVHAVLTEQGLAILNDAPQIMEQDFIDQFQNLESWEQNLILSSLQRLASMMNAPIDDKESLVLLLNETE